MGETRNEESVCDVLSVDAPRVYGNAEHHAKAFAQVIQVERGYILVLWMTERSVAKRWSQAHG